MSTAYTQIIVSAKDEASKVFNTASRRIGIELEKIKKNVFSLQNAFATLGLGYVFEQIFDVGRSLGAIRKAFVEIVGSTQEADKEFQFLRKTADALGQNFYDLLDPYKQLIAASHGTALEGENTRQVFLGLVKAGATLRLSSEQVKGALNAVSQMMSKGNVQAEELRGQLGERLPGAFNLAAEAMGVSTAELNKMLDKGEVAAEDLLPKLAQVLQEKYSGSVDEAVRATNKFNEAWTDFKAAMATGEYMNAAIDALDELSSLLKDKETQRALSDMATGLTRTAGRLVDAVAALDGIFVLYNQLPDEVVGAVGTGVIGRVLFGSWRIGAALAILQTLNTTLKELHTGLDFGSLLDSSASITESFKNIWDGITGKRHWDTGEWLEEGHNTYRARIKRELGDIEGLRDSWLSYYEGLKDANKRANEIITEQNRAAAEAARKATEEREKITEKLNKQRAKEKLRYLSRLKDGWMLFYDGKKKAAERAVQYENQIIEEQIRLREEFTEKYNRVTLGQFEFERQQIRAQAQEYIRAGADAVKVREWQAKEIERITKEETEKQLQESKRWQDGVIRGLNSYADAAKQVEGITVSAFGHMEDAIVDLAMTGKTSFNDMVNAMIADIMRLYVRMQITGPLAQALGSWTSNFFSTPTTTSAPTTGGVGDYYVSSYAAKGDVFSGPGIAAYENQVVNSPTIFPFAKGIGLMGEAGPEAILPLTRTSDGDLGVKAKIDDTPASNVNIKVELKNESGQSLQLTRQETRQGTNPQEYIVTIWLDAYNRNAFGLRDSLGGR